MKNKLSTTRYASIGIRTVRVISYTLLLHLLATQATLVHAGEIAHQTDANQTASGMLSQAMAEAFPIHLATSMAVEPTVSASERYGAGDSANQLLPPSASRRQSSDLNQDSLTRDELDRLFEQPNYVDRIQQDFKALVTSPAHLDRRGWLRVGAGITLVGAISIFDDEIRDAVQSRSTAQKHQLARDIRPLGQELSLAFIGGSWVLGKITKKEGLTAIGRDTLEASLFAAGLITPLTKGTFGRGRPRDGHHPGVLGTSNESFPSGEATQAFAVASVVSAHTDRKWAKAIAWAAASGVAWQRLELDAHWASDVTAGALLGSAIGRWVVRRHQSTVDGERVAWSISPHLTSGSAGLSARWSR